MSSQLDFSVGLGLETNYGVAVPPTRFYESDATFDLSQPTVQGSGMRPRFRIPRLKRNSVQHRAVTGDVALDANTKGLGFLLQAAFGAVTTTMVTTGVFQQVHTLTKDDGVSGLQSYTVQELLPFLGGGALNPHTYTGCMADTLDLTYKEGAYTNLKLGFMGRDLSTAAAATGAVYPVGDDTFNWNSVTISIGPTAGWVAPTTTALATLPARAQLDVVDLSVSLKNNLDSGGYNAGGAGLRTRANLIGQGAVSGKATVEYRSNDLRDAFNAQTPLSLLATHTSGSDVLQVGIPCLRLNSEPPKSSGGAPIKLSLGWDALADDTNEPIYVVYRSSDTAP